MAAVFSGIGFEGLQMLEALRFEPSPACANLSDKLGVSNEFAQATSQRFGLNFIQYVFPLMFTD
jgi:hypothetical protein